MKASVKFNALFIDLSKLLSRRGLKSFFAKEINKLPVNAQVLIIGAGGTLSDYLCSLLKTKGVGYKTFDYDSLTKPDILGDIQNTPLNSAYYDAIFLAEVLEHLPQPQAAISNIYQALKPSGRLLLSVPFIFPLHEQPNDYYRFTKYGLLYLLKPFGEVVVLERNFWPESVFILLARLVKEEGKLNKLLGAIFVLVALCSWPFVFILAQVFSSDFLTTGYTASAKKS
ncbi:MAG: methyltransferase domain-containing protein [Deltaproteobacteria bacterium]|nr:methyltransferase domain-containing protein [Deltaproteobacteria bacterium]